MKKLLLSLISIASLLSIVGCNNSVAPKVLNRYKNVWHSINDEKFCYTVYYHPYDNPNNQTIQRDISIDNVYWIRAVPTDNEFELVQYNIGWKYFIYYYPL